MSVQNTKVTMPEKKDFEPLPTDVYQVQITDIELRTSKKYMSDEEEEQFFFKMNVLDEGEHRGKGVVAFSSQRWFDGGKGLSPSKLFSIFSAIYPHYYPDILVRDLLPEDIDDARINDLIGKQLRVSVQMTPENKNKVTGFLPVKEELPAWHKEGELTKEDVDQIPFQ